MAMATRQQNKKRKARNALQRERTVKSLTDAPPSSKNPSTAKAAAAAAPGVEGGGGAPILAPTLSASSNAMTGYPPPFLPSSYPFSFVHPSMPAINGQQAMPIIQPQINPQYYAQFPQQHIPSAPHLPPGKSDLEILQKLKEMILRNQHEFYKPIPQPQHLAGLYVGPPLAQTSHQQADGSSAASSSSQPAAENINPAIDTDVQMSDVKPEPSPVTIKTSDSSELTSLSALSATKEAQSAPIPQQQQQQQSPVVERSRGPSSVQAREKWEAAKASAAAQAAAAAAVNSAPADAASTSVTTFAPVSDSAMTSPVAQLAASPASPSNNVLHSLSSLSLWRLGLIFFFV
jgi:hypothetical protein